MKQPNAV